MENLDSKDKAPNLRSRLLQLLIIGENFHKREYGYLPVRHIDLESFFQILCAKNEYKIFQLEQFIHGDAVSHDVSPWQDSMPCPCG